ncbi:MAG: hypothetical protein WBE84_20610, partial [Xanthobacteraceae bacterium]
STIAAGDFGDDLAPFGNCRRDEGCKIRRPLRHAIGQDGDGLNESATLVLDVENPDGAGWNDIKPA